MSQGYVQHSSDDLLRRCAHLQHTNAPTSLSIDISIDPFTGRNASYCFVDLPSAHQANLAIQTMQGQLVRGRPVKLNIDTGTRHAPRGPRAHGEKLPVDHRYVYDRWTRDDAPDRWMVPQQEGRRVWVGGVPADVRTQLRADGAMRELFSAWQLEAVSKVILRLSSENLGRKTQRYCFVDFSSKADAEAAVEEVNLRMMREGGEFRVGIARDPAQPTKVMREQFGYMGKEGEALPAVVKRDLEGPWRRLDLTSTVEAATA